MTDPVIRALPRKCFARETFVPHHACFARETSVLSRLAFREIAHGQA